MVVTVPTIGLQGGSLQNDVWLGAWTLECLWALTYDGPAFARSLAVCALIKPVGFVFSALVLIFSLPPKRARLQILAGAWLTALGASSMLAIWVVHVGICGQTQSSRPHRMHIRISSSLVVAHGVEGALTFTRALIAQGLGTVVLLATVLAALFVGKSRARRHLPWMFHRLFPYRAVRV